MVKWATYTSDAVITIPKTKIMTITNATNEMAKSYGQVIKNYDVIDKVLKKHKDLNLKRKIERQTE